MPANVSYITKIKAEICADNIAPTFDVIFANLLGCIACAPEKRIFAAFEIISIIRAQAIIAANRRIVDRKAVDDTARSGVAIDGKPNAANRAGQAGNGVLNRVMAQFEFIEERPIAQRGAMCPADLGLSRFGGSAAGLVSFQPANAPAIALPSPIWRRIADVKP